MPLPITLLLLARPLLNLVLRSTPTTKKPPRAKQENREMKLLTMMTLVAAMQWQVAAQATELDDLSLCTEANKTNGEVCVNELTEERVEMLEDQALRSEESSNNAIADVWPPHDPHHPPHHQPHYLWHCEAYPNGGGHGHSHSAYSYDRYEAEYRARRSCQYYHHYCHVHCHIDHN